MGQGTCKGRVRNVLIVWQSKSADQTPEAQSLLRENWKFFGKDHVSAILNAKLRGFNLTSVLHTVP
jgi:hypothetical protein